ncbi:MAG: hypothetical protein M3Y30_16060 [Gemmatimonadota bacterium]|nr:hypothetical protein [Gemmatimonadota bacterium]
MGAVIVAIAMRKERETAEAFQRSGATSPEHAKSLDEIGIAPHGIGWRRLTERAIVREAAPATYYLDLPSWTASRHMRRKRGLIMIGVLLLFLGAYLVVGPH